MWLRSSRTSRSPGWSWTSSTGRWSEADASRPAFNQAERLAVDLSASGFGLVETVEILVREILAREGRTRPAHRMIGHTQLITTAVKVFPAEELEEESS